MVHVQRTANNVISQSLLILTPVQYQDLLPMSSLFYFLQPVRTMGPWGGYLAQTFISLYPSDLL